MKRLALLLLLCPLPLLAQEAGCTMDVPRELAFESPTWETRTQVVYATVEVQCDAGLPYQIEVGNAEANGVVALTAPGVPSIPIQLVQSDTQAPWGAQAMGEAMGGAGTGERVLHPIEARMALDTLPAAANYRAPLDIVLLF